MRGSLTHALRPPGGDPRSHKKNTRKPYRIDISPPTDDKRMSRIRPLRRAADVGPPPKMDQNLNVSSAAADTTVSPSGDCARCNTLAVWPVSRSGHDGQRHKHGGRGKAVRDYFFVVPAP